VFLNKGGVGGLPFGVIFLNVHLVVLCANCSSHLSVQVLVFLLSSVVQICSPFYVFQIPLPTILDHHQTRNAYIMADIMGAKVITEDELDSSSLTSAVDEIFGDEKLMADMSQKALTAARPNASADIIRHICSLIGSPYPT